MTRPLRMEFKDAFYHILSRGNDGRNIFLDDDDYRIFLDILEIMSARFDVDILAYVLMCDHYHLLVRTNQPNLSKSMQWAGSTYSRRFNLKHLRRGHLFEGRFKSFIVQNDNYLTELSCYIHCNPLRAGLVEQLTDYRWSSYHDYRCKGTRTDWLKKDLILAQCGGKDPVGVYCKRVQKYSKEDAGLFDDLRHGLFLGTRQHLDRIGKKYLNQKPDPELSQLNRVVKDKDPVKSLEYAAKAFDFDLEKLRRSKRAPKEDIRNRDILLCFLKDTGLYTNQQIGDLFNLTYSAVSRRASNVKSDMKKQTSLRRKYASIQSRIKS